MSFLLLVPFLPLPAPPQVDPHLKQALAAVRARKRRLAVSGENEDDAGRPIGLTPSESERALRRQRW